MAADDQSDELARAYARLRGLKDNVPKQHYVGEHYLREYHSALQRLEDLGFDIEEFRLPRKPYIRFLPAIRPAVERSLFLSRLDAVLTYFELASQKPPAIIGFRPPSRQA